MAFGRHFPSHPLTRVLLVLLVLLVLHSVQGVVYKGYVKQTTQRIYYLTRFGYQKGGVATMQVSSSIEGTRIGVFGCTPSETSEIGSTPSDEICSMLNTSTLPCAVKLYGDSKGLDNPVMGSATVNVHNRVYFYIINCADTPQRLEVRLDMVNLHGNHLSTEHLPLPTESLVFLVVYAIVLVAVSLNWIWHIRQNWKLIIFIFLFPLFKAAASLVAYLYWSERRSHGESTKGFVACYYLAYCSADILFFLLLTLCACGHGMVVKGWKPERWPIWATLTFAVPLYIVASFVSSVFAIFSFMVWLGALALASRGSTHNSESANALVAQVDHDPAIEVTRITLRWFSLALFTWIALVIIAFVVNVSILLYHPWVGQTILDSLQLGLFLIIAFLFRLRSTASSYELKPHVMIIAAGSHFTPQQEALIAATYAPYPGEEMQEIPLDASAASLPPLPQQPQQQPPLLDQATNAAPRQPNRSTKSASTSPIVISATFTPPDDDDLEDS